MNILIAIDSFKGSLTTTELSSAIEQGIVEINSSHNIKKIPIADGGEGTTETLVDGLRGTLIEVQVKNPLFQNIISSYGMLQDHTAIIEMASSSGLTLIQPEDRNPLHTTTFGVGDLIKDAIARGVRKFIIGIGGSATNDGGMGMLSSLGVEFYDNNNRLLSPVGSSLIQVHRIDMSNLLPELSECEFLIACDVDNPLYGLNGAAHVYGKQKGATPTDILMLDEGLMSFAETVKEQLGKDLSHVPGTGAAGGLGYGFLTFLNAELKPGIDIIFEKLDVEDCVKWADLIITGEGRLDFQTVMGKAPMGIGKLALKYDKTVIALAGSVTDEAFKAHDYGITSMFSIMDSPMSLDEAMDKHTAKKLVTKKVSELFRLIETFNKRTSK